MQPILSKSLLRTHRDPKTSHLLFQINFTYRDRDTDRPELLEGKVSHPSSQDRQAEAELAI